MPPNLYNDLQQIERNRNYTWPSMLSVVKHQRDLEYFGEYTSSSMKHNIRYRLHQFRRMEKSCIWNSTIGTSTLSFSNYFQIRTKMMIFCVVVNWQDSRIWGYLSSCHFMSLAPQLMFGSKIYGPIPQIIWTCWKIVSIKNKSVYKKYYDFLTRWNFTLSYTIRETFLEWTFPLYNLYFNILILIVDHEISRFSMIPGPEYNMDRGTLAQGSHWPYWLISGVSLHSSYTISYLYKQ